MLCKIRLSQILWFIAGCCLKTRVRFFSGKFKIAAGTSYSQEAAVVSRTGLD